MPDNSIELGPVFLMYAFRYALGRTTSAVADVADALIVNRDALTSDGRRQIVQDINNAVADGRAGQPSDVARWQEVARVMAG